MAYLPVSLLIATALIFGIRVIPLLLIGVYLVFRNELNVTQFQATALTASVVLPLGLSLFLLFKHQGRRYRAAAVNSRGTLMRMGYLGLLYPVLMELSLYFVGMATRIEDDFQYYFSVNEIMLLLRNLQSLVLPAVVFTPLFYHFLRMLSSATYMNRFIRQKLLSKPLKTRSLVWFSLLASLFSLYICILHSPVLSSYVIPVVFLIFVYGFINFDQTIISLLWGMAIYVIIRYDSDFISLIQKDKLLICFSSLFMVFTVANTWLSAMRDQLTRAIEKLYASSRRDPLTSIPNLPALKDLLETEKQEQCLCYIKLFTVEKIEKHLGFTFKANVKRTLYSQLKRFTGEKARIFSTPNSDLLLLLPLKGAVRNISKIHAHIKNISVLDKSMTFSVSCGYAWVQTDTIIDLEQTICGLEYLATQGGEGSISSLRDNDAVVEQFTTLDINKLDEIRQAINNDGIRLYVQKIAGIKAGCDYHEVLCRLEYAGRLLTPDIFLPVITEFNMASFFDFKVIETLLRTYGTDTSAKYSVNIMPETLGDTMTASRIITLFRNHRIPPGNIIFEVTEEQLFYNEVKALKNIVALREAGFRIAIDDFGRGYANFERLKTLEADILKIDGMFIKHIVSSQTDAMIVQSITRIAGLKGMEVVAEYVETQQHAELLAKMNVDYLQGYFIGKPQPLPAC
ncbi:EAL domain-containing protein [Enterobacter hormaechei]|nr:EAL domain-containing protein [Enterobacter hormaechei]